MSRPAERLAALLENRFAQWLSDCHARLGEVTIEVPAGHLRELCLALRDQEEFAFQQLVDLCGIDYLDYGRADWETSETASTSGFSRGVQLRAHGAGPGEDVSRPRFAVVYHLLSHHNNQRIRVRCAAQGEPPRVDSVVDIWNSANWYEREAFDLFGILFVGHPDLRRLLCDYGFIGHPFRKDFPLTGEVEMRYDPERGRVIYEPVSIEPRTLVPKVIRDTVDDPGGDGGREHPADA